jgi:LysM repeat protein
MRMSSCPAETFPYTVQSGDSLWLIAQRFHTSVQEIASANPELGKNSLYIGQTLCIPQRYSRISTESFPTEINRAELMLSNSLRMLWSQHVYWTRMVINSIAFELPDLNDVTNRLLRNPKNFETALAVFYGADISAQFAKMLTDHLVIAAELVKAAKAGDQAMAADAEKRWYANADEIANFLGNINPYWSEQEWRRLLYNHLAMTKTEAVDLLTQKFEDSIQIFEKIELEAMEMADLMTLGIVKQFSQYFQ